MVVLFSDFIFPFLSFFLSSSHLFVHLLLLLCLFLLEEGDDLGQSEEVLIVLVEAADIVPVPVLLWTGPA
jgi:hypothetical protein